MSTLLRIVTLGIVVAGAPAFGQDSSYLISGFVNTVGSNHGSVIDGVGSTEGVDRFDIRLRFDFDQTATATAYPEIYGGGFYTTYKLHETQLTIHADDGPLIWSYSHYPTYASDHGLWIIDGYSGEDKIGAGVDDGVLTGSLINGQIVTSWVLNLTDVNGTVFSDTSLPQLIDVGAFEIRQVMLGVGIEGFHPNNMITMEVDRMVLESAGAIPEPSTWAVIAGGLVLGAAGWSKRRGGA